MKNSASENVIYKRNKIAFFFYEIYYLQMELKL
jgi:hypothetical protein